MLSLLVKKRFDEAVGLFGNGQKVLQDGSYHLKILEKVSLA